MEIIRTAIEGPLIIKPDIFSDDRGYFYEVFNSERFRSLGLEDSFCQDNESRSARHVLRGLHFQVAPHGQGKLVRVVSGSVLDVAVDLRKDSPTYGKHVTTMLSGSGKTIFWIPSGFAHGFLSLEEDSIFVYKCTMPYHRESERCIRWNDPDLAINWGIDRPVVSEKDAQGMFFREFSNSF